VNESEAKRDPLVVVVEDDAAIAEGLALNLNLQGYRSAVVGDGETAYPHIKETQPDLVLLDITLPKQSGIWVLERLREDGNHVPVIVLSARQNEFDKVAALQLGADDYVTKPFALAELLARVAAVLRRAQLSNSAPEARLQAASGHHEGAFQFGDVVVDLQTRTVTRANQDIRLTHLEFELLSFFCHHSQRVYSREELLHEVWGVRHAGQARTVDNFMAQLRAKLELDPDRPRHLLTVRGSGYRFLPA
jgi:two-component system alkaline phosphatase synthesis response regulator PhoP